MRVGEAIFIDTCSACHMRSGAGVEHIFPRLAGNAIVKQADPTTLVRIILTGSRAAGTDVVPTSPAIPSLGYRLKDGQVAAVVTYIRNAWGNAAPAVSADTVKALRDRVANPAQQAVAR
jgi:mono/diheme cytochrome c family protein